MEEQSAEKKIDESNTGEKNGGQSNADMSQKVQTPEKPLLKEMADSTTKGSCFEPHYEPCKHPGCPKHVRHLKKRKLFNDSNDGSVEDVGTRTSMESEMELPKKVSGGNADKHSEGELPRSTPAKKDSGGNTEWDDAMQCWSSLLPESAQGQYYVTVAGKRMLIIVKEKKRKTESVKLMMKQRRRVMVYLFPNLTLKVKVTLMANLTENNSAGTQSMIDLPKVSSGEGYSVSDTEASF